MCGIAGANLRQGSPDKGMADKFIDALRHRGPDGHGYYVNAQTLLVHTRLSIIDVAGGAQPLFSQNKKHVVVGNGEIYNYKKLTKNYDDYPFTTGSDIETVLPAYLAHEENFPTDLCGMYGLALYDQEKETLFLARDPLGIKQVYLAQTKAGVAFASEPAALTKSGWCDARLNTTQVLPFLNRQFTSGRDTLFQGIERLLPGELVAIKHGKILYRRQLKKPELEKPQLENPQLAKLQGGKLKVYDQNAALSEFETYFSSAVESHLQSDVPYAVFLSGGVDSSSIVASMAKKNVPIHAYTLGFEGNRVSDERTKAMALCAHVGAKVTSVDFGRSDFWHYLKYAVQHVDDAVADYAILPVMKLADVATEKVILSGEGGDEIFAGYGRYKPKWYHRLMGRSYRGSGMLAGATDIWTDYVKSWREPALDIEMPDGVTALQRYQFSDIKTWLADDLLIKADRALMAYGKEGRVPYLADDLVAFGLNTPDAFKMKGRQGKWLPKTWLSRTLSHIGMNGDDFAFSKKKGFTVPLETFIAPQQEKIINYLVTHHALKEIIVPSALKKWHNKPVSKKQAKMIFTLLTLCLWVDYHINKNTRFLDEICV